VWSQAPSPAAKVADVVAVTAPEVREDVVRRYFAAGGKDARGALTKAAFGRMNYHTARTLVLGHDTLESALAALAVRRAPGRQTHLSTATEDALAAVIYLCWQQGRTLSKEMIMCLASIEADKAGTPFLVRRRRFPARWPFRSCADTANPACVRACVRRTPPARQPGAHPRHAVREGADGVQLVHVRRLVRT
jgi:hypothetical protein